MGGLAIFTKESPPVSLVESEVLLGYPLSAFVWMAADTPFPNGFPDVAVYPVECLFGAAMPMIHRPPLSHVVNRDGKHTGWSRIHLFYRLASFVQ